MMSQLAVVVINAPPGTAMDLHIRVSAFGTMYASVDESEEELLLMPGIRETTEKGVELHINVCYDQ
jgi:hypothetical protein